MAAGEKILLTVILHHDQSKTLEQLQDQLKQTGFYRDFPPEGTELVSWTAVMSFGNILLLQVEADKLRNLNRYMETKAFGAFRYEVYPSYDFRAIAEKLKQDHA
jgi:hypothetical protein